MTRPPIILVHGMWCKFDIWGETPKVLEAAGWRIIRYELPGHGLRQGQGKPLGEYGLKDYAADLVGVVEKEPVPPILIGHSMGGFLSLKAAELAKTAAVFLVAPAGAAGRFPFSLANMIFFFRPVVLQMFGTRPYKPTRWESDFGLGNRLSEAAKVELHANLQKESPWPLLQIALWFLNPRGAFYIDPARIGVPVRLYLGLKDRITPPYLASGIVPKVRDGRIHRDPTGSHMVFLQDDRARFFTWLLAELDALSLASPATTS
jgi:pimeloyl-ACP methyl ester carboxylesterase